MLSQFLFCLSLIYICDAAAQYCDECIPYRTCPEAIYFVKVSTNTTMRDNKLKASFCGVQKVNGKSLPRVCCSLYRTTNSRSQINGDVDEKYAIEDHPNVDRLPSDCGKINGDRIFGGKVANLYEFPWMALISQKSRIMTANGNQDFKCSGTIINSRYVLTAAHCVVNRTLYKVRIGEFDIDSLEDCQGEYPNIICESHIQDIAIKKVVPHENYRRKPSVNDIALLYLEEPIDFSHKNAAPICLPVSQELRNGTLGGRTATVAGWGMTEYSQRSSILQKVDIPILTSSNCREKKPETTSKHLCAGEIGKDACNGDSGGPLMIENEIEDKFIMVQYGIVSYGPRECGTDIPGVYTDIASHMEWILDNIAE